MATNNGTPEVHNDAHVYSSSDSEAGALNTTNGGMVIIENGAEGKKRAYINDITKGQYG